MLDLLTAPAIALLTVVSAASDAGCALNGVPLHGRVRVVDSFPDFTVKTVTSFPDLRVRQVESFPDECGEWLFVDSFPDFTIRYVDSFPDLKIQFVDSFPGLP